RERALLESLLKNAEPGAIPQKDLAELARLIHEEEELATERVALESGLHESEEAVVSFSKIDCSRVREYAYHTARPKDHAMPRRIAIAAATEPPSIRNPVGATIVTVPTGGASITSTAFIAAAAPQLASLQRRSVCAGTPSAAEMSVHHSPRSRCAATHAV